MIPTQVVVTVDQMVADSAFDALSSVNLHQPPAFFIVGLRVMLQVS
jgi:hypothetical protein